MNLKIYIFSDVFLEMANQRAWKNKNRMHRARWATKESDYTEFLRIKKEFNAFTGKIVQSGLWEFIFSQTKALSKWSLESFTLGVKDDTITLPVDVETQK